MFTVNEIWDEAKKILGACDEQKLFRWLGDAVSLISSKEDLEVLERVPGYLHCGMCCLSSFRGTV